MNHVGVAMGRNAWYKKGLPLVSSLHRLAIWREMPSALLHHHITGQAVAKNEAFITWLREQVKTTS